MIKEVVKFENFDGVEVQQDCWFNLNKGELIKLNLTKEGNLQTRLRAIYKTKDTTELIRVIDEIICSAYGVRDEDGIHFHKGGKHLQDFKESEAYSEILTKCLQDVDFCAKFIQGMLPKDMQDTKVDNSDVVKMLES